MMVGELQYTDTFQDQDILINLIFFVFVIGIPIIINNLLVGLTVDNVKDLTDHATQKGLESQLETLETLETIRRSLTYSKV